MIKKLVIVGAGDLGQLIAFHALESKQYEFIGFYDDTRDVGTETEFGTIIGHIPNILNDYKKYHFEEIIIGIGYKHLKFKQQLFETLVDEIPFATIIHKSANIASNCKIGKGTVILSGCNLDKGVIIGDNTFLNIGCTIAHDSIIESHCFLAPGVIVAGFVEIQKRGFIGIGTTIINNINICEDVQTGGGSVIIKNISEPGIYIGAPAKKKYE